MVGAGCAAVQNVVQGAVKHGPVAVTMPTVPMGPTPFMPGAPPTINGMSIDEFLKKYKALNYVFTNGLIADTQSGKSFVGDFLLLLYPMPSC